ncbi:MAG: flagellar basal-body rod protein FlgG [Maricaulaceae bacterium]
MRALSTAATGMLAQQLNVEVISNNIANLNTTGFKRQRADFQDLLYQTIEQVGAASSDAGTIVPTGVQVGLGVRAGATYRITEQGSLQQTGNTFDLAISGAGFFSIQLPNGETAFTRSGNFGVSANGELVTQDGFVVAPGINVPDDARDIIVNDQGQVQAVLDGDPNPQDLGQIELALFFNEAGLEAVGDNLFLESAASGPATVGAPGQPGFGSIRQGFVESSNVDPVKEITTLIQAQRAYDLNAQVITTADEMLATAGQLR